MKPDKQEVAEAIANQSALVGPALMRQMTSYGMWERWPKGDYSEMTAESLSEIAEAAGLPRVDGGDEKALRFWRAMAGELGYDHDGDPVDADDFCPESEDGEHVVTSGSCDECGAKNLG